LAAQQDPAPVAAARLLTVLGFRIRFTAAEKVAIAI
jgi:hypothetical protein